MDAKVCHSENRYYHDRKVEPQIIQQKSTDDNLQINENDLQPRTAVVLPDHSEQRKSSQKGRSILKSD